jgi:hypothetical protein
MLSLVDISNNKNKSILFIKGITKEDIVKYRNQSLYDDSTTIIKNYENDESQIYNIETIPDNFIDMNSWPKYTNIRCSNCHLKHSNPPFPLSKEIKIENDKIIYPIYKMYFCNIICANVKNLTLSDSFNALINEERLLNIYNTHFLQFNDNKKYNSVPKLQYSYNNLNIYSGNDGISVEQYEMLVNKYYKTKYSIN